MEQAYVGQQRAQADGIDQRRTTHVELQWWSWHVGYDGIEHGAGLGQTGRTGGANGERQYISRHDVRQIDSEAWPKCLGIGLRR